MSGDGNTKYVLVTPNLTGEDREFFIFRFHKAVESAKNFFNEKGKSKGNGYDWRDLEDEVKPFSAKMADQPFEIHESGSFDGEPFAARYYFLGGKSAVVHATYVETWPDFDESMLK